MMRAARRASLLVAFYLLAGCCHEQQNQQQNRATWVLWAYWQGGVVRQADGGLYNRPEHYEALLAFTPQTYPTLGAEGACLSRKDSYEKSKNPGWTFVCLPDTLNPRGPKGK